MRKLFLIGVCGLALGAAGCGDDEEDSTTGGDTGTGTQPAKTSAGGGGAGKAREIVMKDTKFTPASVTVKKGTTVTWPNEDSFPHDVTKDKGPGPDFKSGNIAAGDSYKHKFSTAGKIDYVCTIHPGQRGSLTITK